MDLPPGPPPSDTAPTPVPARTAVPATNPGPAPTAPTTTEERSTTFKPVTGAPEMQSGEKLLVEAYAAIWIILFAMVLLSWRRQRQLEARIDGLEGAIAKARSGGHDGGAPQTPGPAGESKGGA